jgi:zinc protease
MKGADMKNAVLMILCLVLFCGPAQAQKPAPREKIFGAESFTLSNGLRVVVIPNHRAPVVTHMVWYKVGGADEMFGRTGLAHFLEHLMFKGSEHVPPGELSKRVRAMGGEDNAFTTQDYTAFFQNIAASRLKDVMEMESDRMKSILVPPDHFASEKQVVLEERRQNTETDPRAFFAEQMRYSLFPGHPYAAPVIGWKQDIERLSRDDALAFHQKWYAPNNAILIVGGDITAAQLKPLAEATYGAIPAREVPKSTLPEVSPFPGEPRLVLRDARIEQPAIMRFYRVPGIVKNKSAGLALQVLTEIMSGNPSARLYKSLVVEQKLATGVDLGYQDQVRDDGILSAGLIPAEGVALETLEAAFDAEVKKIADGGVSPEELAAAKIRMKDSAAFARDSLSGPARLIGQALATGSTLDDVEYWPYDIDAVTPAQVRDAAMRYLRNNQSRVTGFMLPAQGEKK